MPGKMIHRQRNSEDSLKDLGRACPVLFVTRVINVVVGYFNMKVDITAK